MSQLIGRRGLIGGLIGLVAAPAVVKANSIMPVKLWKPPSRRNMEVPQFERPKLHYKWTLEPLDGSPPVIIDTGEDSFIVPEQMPAGDYRVTVAVDAPGWPATLVGEGGRLTLPPDSFVRFDIDVNSGLA